MKKSTEPFWLLEYSRNIGALFEVGVIYYTGGCENELAVIKAFRPVEGFFVHTDFPYTEMARQLVVVGRPPVQIRGHGSICRTLAYDKFKQLDQEGLLKLYERIKETGKVLENEALHKMYKKQDLERGTIDKPFIDSLEKKLKTKS